MRFMSARTILTGVVAAVTVLAASSCTMPGIAGQRPSAAKPELAEMRDIRVDVLRNNITRVQGSEVPLVSLGNYLARIAEKLDPANIRVIVSAREDTPYGMITRAIAAARAAGFGNVMLAPNPIAK
jgi:biopolymer transport protein ExbD